jgi:DNA-binding transcriptional LysR family regulator
MSMNLNDLSHFAHVVTHGGFAPAARRTGIPKSTLAKRVAALEAALGARLIQRSSRRFVVTDLGQEVYRHAAAMVIEAESAAAVVQGRVAEPSGLVRITASVPTAQLSLAAPLLELARTYPKLRVALHTTDRFVDLVQEGIDIAVRDHFAPLPDSGLVQRRVCSDPIYLVAAPDYVARHGAPSTPAALDTHAGLMTSAAQSVWRLEDADGAAAEARPQPRLAADESQVLLRAACGGLGIACLPRRLCGPMLGNGELVRVLPTWTAGTVTTTLLMPHRRGQLPAVRAVADALASTLGSDPVFEQLPKTGL